MDISKYVRMDPKIRTYILLHHQELLSLEKYFNISIMNRLYALFKNVTSFQQLQDVYSLIDGHYFK